MATTNVETKQITNSDICKKLDELGVKAGSAPVWTKQGDEPLFSEVTADIVNNPIERNGKSVVLSSLKLPAEDGGFRFVSLGKNVPNTKKSYDIYLYVAVRDFPETAKEKERFANVDPVVKGQVRAYAH